ncbi:MAG: MFS transporter [Gammaproteobacteria bacterium]
MNAPMLPFTSVETRAVSSLTLLYILRVLGLFLLYPVLAAYAGGLPGHTPVLVGISLGIYGLSQAALQVPMGLLSDRFGRKPIMTLGLICLAVGSVMAAQAETIFAFAIARFLQGAGAISGVCAAMLADSVAPTRRSLAMAFIGMGIGLTFTVSLVLGPWLAARFDVPGVFYLMTFSAIGGLALLWFVVPNVPRVLPELTWLAGLKKLSAMPIVWIFSGSVGLLHAILASVFMVVPQQLVVMTGKPLDAYTGIYAVAMTVILVATLIYMRWLERQPNRYQGMLWAVLALLLGQALLYLPMGTMATFVTGLFIFFVGFNVLEALLPAWLSREVPDTLRGAAMGIFTTCQFMGIFLGGVLSGLLIKYAPSIDIHFAASWVILLWAAMLWKVLPVLTNRTTEQRGSQGKI